MFIASKGLTTTRKRRRIEENLCTLNGVDERPLDERQWLSQMKKKNRAECIYTICESIQCVERHPQVSSSSHGLCLICPDGDDDV